LIPCAGHCLLYTRESTKEKWEHYRAAQRKKKKISDLEETQNKIQN
jgi:hypothetical protein